MLFWGKENKLFNVNLLPLSGSTKDPSEGWLQQGSKAPHFCICGSRQPSSAFIGGGWGKRHSFPHHCLDVFERGPFFLMALFAETCRTRSSTISSFISVVAILHVPPPPPLPRPPSLSHCEVWECISFPPRDDLSLGVQFLFAKLFCLAGMKRGGGCV